MHGNLVVRRAVAVATKFIERALDEMSIKILDGRTPIILVGEGVIQDFGIPFAATGENDMRKFLEFTLRVWLHLETQEAIDDVKGDNASIIRDKTQFAANLHGMITNFVVVQLDVSRGVNCSIETMCGGVN